MIDNSSTLLIDKANEPAPRLRLHYLDGLRGTAAVAVVLNHARLQASYHGGHTAWQHTQFGLVQLFSDGRAAVGIFIVLSGYCLMLPVVQSSDGAIRGGTVVFLLRRAKRILPPYYIALALILAAVGFIPKLNQSTIPQWRDALPIQIPMGILSHVFLLHNWNSHWFFNIDPPAWTVATEWQIYFAFAIFLLPIWRKFGSTATVLAAFFGGFLPLIVFHHGQGASPWFLGLFAIGMAAATINFSPRVAHLHSRVSWSVLTVIFFSLAVLFENLYLVPEFRSFTKGIPDGFYNYYWILDTLVGLATGCFLVYCTNFLVNPSASVKPVVLQVLESSKLVSVGAFSYSLYLVHDPLLAITCFYIRGFHLSDFQQFVTLVALGLPISLLGAYLFHLAFERRFMGGASKAA